MKSPYKTQKKQVVLFGKFWMCDESVNSNQFLYITSFNWNSLDTSFQTKLVSALNFLCQCGLFFFWHFYFETLAEKWTKLSFSLSFSFCESEASDWDAFLLFWLQGTKEGRRMTGKSFFHFRSSCSTSLASTPTLTSTTTPTSTATPTPAATAVKWTYQLLPFCWRPFLSTNIQNLKVREKRKSLKVNLASTRNFTSSCFISWRWLLTYFAKIFIDNLSSQWPTYYEWSIFPRSFHYCPKNFHSFDATNALDLIYCGHCSSARNFLPVLVSVDLSVLKNLE